MTAHDAGRRAVDAERPAPVLGRVHLLDQADGLRGDESGGRPAGQPRGDEHRGAGGRAAQDAGEGEQRQPDQQQPASAEQVAEPPGRHQDEAEGERVSGQGPGDLGGCHPQGLLHGRQGDGDDAHVEQGQEPPDHADEQGRAAPWRALDGIVH
jgi:hypothetical protein